MQRFGKVKPGSTLYVYFDTFDGGTGASITMTGLAVTDIEIYKDGSVTQRASDTGYTLLDTDGIDFDALTGIHGFSIDLSSNADANFYEAGSHYVVVVSAITVDAQTVSFVAADFTIGYEGAVLDTTIATLATQTSFTLEEGPAEDDALNGAVCIIHDLASAVQAGFAVVNDYTGATKTVTLAAGVTFTAAAGDNISFFPPSNLQYITGSAVSTTTAQLGVNTVQAGGTAWGSGAITAASIATDAIGAAELADGAITAATFAAGAIDAAAIATGAIDADALAADAGTELGTAVWATAARTLTAATNITSTGATTVPQTGDSFARLGAPAGASIAADLAAIEAQTDDIGVAGAGLTAIPWNAAWDAEIESEALDALNTMLADSIPADGTLPTVRQALYMITQFLYERSVSGTTVTVRKADGATTLLTLTLSDGTSPTSITRST